MSVEEVVLKASLVDLQIRELEKTLNEARDVMREAATKIQAQRGEIEDLRMENDLMKARLRIVELRNVKRAEFGKLPPMLRAQGEST